MRLTTLSLALLAALPALAPARAADVPSMVGTWKVAGDHATARIGTSPGHARLEDKVSTTADQAWSLEIQGQDGRAFYGTTVGPAGKAQKLVGVFRADGKRFRLSTDNGSADGAFDGGRFELCWSDALPTLVAVDCALYSK